MKKKKVALGRKLTLTKEMITGLNDKLQDAILGGATGKGCAVSGTGCGCDPQASCGIVLCTAYAGCQSKECPEM
ncbi:class I lanthipeptide [Taibaiella helva]|uniref:class I lanthipeptide n=1 Tax=Taibaiella helva TaxID=2301235 RepID=UPI000E577AD3|nr:class I lanthipeptide [Taibaiella helva]